MKPIELELGYYQVLPPRAGSGGYVYFVRCHNADGHVKIGHANDLSKCLLALQRGCPYEIVLLATRWTSLPNADERRYHQAFARDRIRPRGEWFRATPEIEAECQRIRAERARLLAELLS